MGAPIWPAARQSTSAAPAIPGPYRTGCDIGSWVGRRPSLGGYVTGTGPTPGRPLPAGVHVAYPLDYPSRKEFLEDYRRRTAGIDERLRSLGARITREPGA